MSTTSEEGLEGGYWEEEEAMVTEVEVEEGAVRRCTVTCLIGPVGRTGGGVVLEVDGRRRRRGSGWWYPGESEDGMRDERRATGSL
jgi:hypothetical protein